MSALLSREVIVGLAILGGLTSIVAIVLKTRDNVDDLWITRINRLAYTFMGLSILLFIVKGFMSVQSA